MAERGKLLVRGLIPAIGKKFLDQLTVFTWAGFEEIDEIDHLSDNFLRRGMLYFAGPLFSGIAVNTQDLDEKLFERLMAPDHVQRDFPSLFGEGDRLIRSVIDEPLFGPEA